MSLTDSLCEMSPYLEIYFIILPIQSERGKIHIRKTLNTYTFTQWLHFSGSGSALFTKVEGSSYVF